MVGVHGHVMDVANSRCLLDIQMELVSMQLDIQFWSSREMLDMALGHVVGIFETVDGFNVIRKEEITQKVNVHRDYRWMCNWERASQVDAYPHSPLLYHHTVRKISSAPLLLQGKKAAPSPAPAQCQLQLVGYYSSATVNYMVSPYMKHLKQKAT